MKSTAVLREVGDGKEQECKTRPGNVNTHKDRPSRGGKIPLKAAMS